jgi:hypothetical protein
MYSFVRNTLTITAVPFQQNTSSTDGFILKIPPSHREDVSQCYGEGGIVNEKIKQRKEKADIKIKY